MAGKIFYVCDGKACEDHGRLGGTCYLRRGADGCHHTSDIRHAIDFVETVNGGFMQRLMVNGVELPTCRKEGGDPS